MTFLPRFLTASPARAAVALALFAAGSAMAANVKPAGVTASSSYPDENGASYNPEKATDGKLSTSWVEGDQGSGLGSWIEVDLGGAKTVRAIKVWGGLQSSGDYWSRANRPHDLEILFSDGSKQTVTMTDKMVGQELQLPTPK